MFGWGYEVESWLKLGLIKICRDTDVCLRFWCQCLIEILKLKFDQDLCKNLWSELIPRVRCAFGNVLISMPSYATKLSHYHYELHITQYCAMQTFTFWQKSDISVLNQTFSIQFWSALQPWFMCKEIRKREICWYFPIVDCWSARALLQMRRLRPLSACFPFHKQFSNNMFGIILKGKIYNF